jgi:hypothetical protein
LRQVVKNLLRVARLQTRLHRLNRLDKNLTGFRAG